MMKPTLNRPESTGRSVRVDVRLDDIGLDSPRRRRRRRRHHHRRRGGWFAGRTA